MYWRSTRTQCWIYVLNYLSLLDFSDAVKPFSKKKIKGYEGLYKVGVKKEKSNLYTYIWPYTNIQKQNYIATVTTVVSKITKNWCEFEC